MHTFQYLTSCGQEYGCHGEHGRLINCRTDIWKNLVRVRSQEPEAEREDRDTVLEESFSSNA
jgi:hypothetical protein